MMDMATEKENAILEAALGAFVRYGFRRVTMGDIAQKAGMSRPALYLAFPNKEAIFRAVLADFVARLDEEARAGLDEHETVADKLGFVLEVWTVRPFELIRDTPDAKELTDCSHEFASDVVEDSRRRFEAALAGVLEPGADALARRDLTPDRVARVLAISTDSFKERARDADELRALIAGLIGMTEAALGR